MEINNEEISEEEILRALAEQGSYAKFSCKDGKEIIIIIRPVQKEACGNWTP